MVRLTEVEDEHFGKEKPTASKHDDLLVSDDDDEDFTDTDSEISNDDDYAENEEESIFDRLAALQDMIPPQSRRRISNTVSALSSFTKSTFSFGGKSLWVISTSAFLLGVPWALALAEEQQYVQMEREQGMIKGANEMLTPGATSALTAPSQEEQAAKPAL